MLRERGEHQRLALLSVSAVLLELEGAAGHHRTVRRKEGAGLFSQQPIQRGKVVGHVALGRVDDHGADSRHQVARHHRAAADLDQAEVPARVAWQVQRAPAAGADFEPVAVPQYAIDLEVEQRSRLGAGGDGQPQHLRAAHMIEMMVREQDADCFAPLGGEAVERVAQDGLLLRPRRAWIDDPQLVITEQEAVGVGRGRQRGRPQRHQQQAALELDPLDDVLFHRQPPRRLVRSCQERQRVAWRGSVRERFQGMPRRRMQQGCARLPAPQRLGGEDPFAHGQFARPDLRLLSLRKLDQVEARIEADGHRLGSHPAPRFRELPRVDAQTVAREEVAERGRRRPGEQRLADFFSLLPRDPLRAGHRQNARLLEQLACGRRHAGRLGGVERLAVLKGHGCILDVDSTARKCVEARRKAELLAAPHPEHAPICPDQHH